MNLIPDDREFVRAVLDALPDHVYVKDINGRYLLVNAAGDEALREVATRFASSVRSSDTVARLGGDEFAVVLGDLAAAHDAGAVAQKILAAMQAPVRIAGREIPLGVSIGVALFPRDGRDLDGLLKRADAAMYRAKAAGRNCFRYFGEDLERPSDRE